MPFLEDEWPERHEPSCFALISDPTRLAERTQRMDACVTELANYYELLKRARSETERRGCDLGSMVSERAYVAERGVRMMIADSLATLNDLRDSRELELGFAETAEVISKVGTDAFTAECYARVRAVADEVSARLHLPPNELITRVLGDLPEIGRIGAADDNEVVLEVRQGEAWEEIRLHAKPAQYQRRRVSVQEFFAPDLTLGPVARAQFNKLEAGSSDDVYWQLVSALLVFREEMYAHARRMAAFGPGTTSGNDPATATAAVGFGLIILGLYIGARGTAKVINGDSTGWVDIGIGVFVIVLGAFAIAGVGQTSISANGIEILLNPPPTEPPVP